MDLPSKLKTIEVDCKYYRGDRFIQIFSNLVRYAFKFHLDLRVYLLLIDYAGEKDTCYPSQTRMAKELGISKRTLTRSLERLKNDGFITYKQRGFMKTNLYKISRLKFSKKCGQLCSDKSCVTNSKVTPVTTPCKSLVTNKVYTLKDIHFKNTLTIKEGKLKKNVDKSEDFDFEAKEIARELEDLKSIAFYQKLLNRRDRQEFPNSVIQQALIITRDTVNTAREDGTSQVRNPGALFNRNFQRLLEAHRRKQVRNELKKIIKDKSITKKLE